MSSAELNDTEDHRRAVVEFYERLWNQHDLTALSQLVDSEVNFRGSLGESRQGPLGLASYVDEVHHALANYRCEVEELVADDERAAVQVRFSGVHRAPLLAVAATGRRVEWAGAAFFRFRAGLMTDIWVLGDLAALRQQLLEGSEPATD